MASTMVWGRKSNNTKTIKAKKIRKKRPHQKNNLELIFFILCDFKYITFIEVASHSMVQQRRRLALRSGWPGSSGGDVWQIDQGSIARRCDGFQRDVAGSLDGPLVVLLELACPGFRGHRDRCHTGTGGQAWDSEGRSAASSSSRL